MVATELPEHENTSVTNPAEYLAAEVMERYLTADQLAGHDPPFIRVERYRRRRPHPARGERGDLTARYGRAVQTAPYVAAS